MPIVTDPEILKQFGKGPQAVTPAPVPAFQAPQDPRVLAQEGRAQSGEARAQAAEGRASSAEARAQAKFEQEQAQGGMTESQAKGLGYYRRALQSNIDLNRLNLPPDSAIGLWTYNTSPTVSGMTSSDPRNSARSAVTDFINATLRQESGAAIGKDEFVRQYQIYFPGPSAGPEEIERKRKAREAAISDLSAVAGTKGAAQAQDTLKGLGYLNDAGKPIDVSQQNVTALPGNATPQEGQTYEADALHLQRVAQLQGIFDQGATADQLQQAAAQLGLGIPRADQLQAAIDFRDKGGKGVKILPPPKVENAQSLTSSLVGQAADLVTGNDRSTTTTEKLSDWVDMPELNQMTLGAWKAGLGTAFGGSAQEIAQIVQNTIPGAVVWQDEKGNYIIRSPSDGKDYAIKPGFQVSDVPRAVGSVALGALTGGVGGVASTALREAGLQAGIEAVQAGIGGEFNPLDVVAAGGAGAAGRMITERALPAATQAVRRMDEHLAPTPTGNTGGAIPAIPGGGEAPAPTITAMPSAPARPEYTPGDVIPGQTGAGGAMDTSGATKRVAIAQGLPVPIELTRGAATREAGQLAFEKEAIKSEIGAPLRQRAEANNRQALQNFDQMIDATGAESQSAFQTGTVVQRALGEGYDAAKNRVRRAYKLADQAGETTEPVAYKPVMDFIDDQTPTMREKLSPILNAVAEQIRKNDPDATGKMTISQLEDIRKLVNKAAPNDAFGAQVKDLIDQSTENAGGDLYRRARATRRQQARIFENRAVVANLVKNIRGMEDPRVAADDVFSKTILGSNPDEIKFLRRVLTSASGVNGNQAWRELQGATLRHIQDRATGGVGMSANDLPMVSPSKLNQAVDSMEKSGHLDAIFDPKTAQTIRDLNDVVRYVNTVPPGTLINSSGTTQTLMKAIGEMTLTGAGTGIPLPLLNGLKFVRGEIAERKMKAKISRALNALDPSK